MLSTTSGDISILCHLCLMNSKDFQVFNDNEKINKRFGLAVKKFSTTPNSNLVCLIFQNEWNPINKWATIFIMSIYKGFHLQLVWIRCLQNLIYRFLVFQCSILIYSYPPVILRVSFVLFWFVIIFCCCSWYLYFIFFPLNWRFETTL